MHEERWRRIGDGDNNEDVVEARLFALELRDNSPRWGELTAGRLDGPGDAFCRSFLLVGLALTLMLASCRRGSSIRYLAQYYMLNNRIAYPLDSLKEIGKLDQVRMGAHPRPYSI